MYLSMNQMDLHPFIGRNILDLPADLSVHSCRPEAWIKHRIDLLKISVLNIDKTQKHDLGIRWDITFTIIIKVPTSKDTVASCHLCSR
ncbi:hypothetical protein [Candidatus Nitrospira salsa]